MERRIIGLTGAIATGKSTVAGWLVEWGVPVADADVLAREAVRPGTKILQKIRDRYGSDILDDLGQLNRKMLGTIIFDSPEERAWLEAQIHPFVRLQLELFIAQLPPDATAAIVVPLLFESGMTDLVDEIWTITCSSQQQRDRLTQRDGLSVSEAQSRIDSQWPLSRKAILSDVVIDNSGDLSYAYHQTIDSLEPKLVANGAEST
ncbi:MAG: dephospho-CoA kinase [Cyanobacteria bacterium P01_E01_bin.34]